MSSDDIDKFAQAFVAELDDIKVTDVSPERTEGFTCEDDFNGLSVELLIEVGSYIVVAGNLLPADSRRWDRNQAVLGGHLVRLYKLISALLDQICQRRREITFIIARLAFECIVNMRFLLKNANPETFDSYIRHSLRQEKRLTNRIQQNIADRNGESLPVESRMLESIDKVLNVSGLGLDDISESQPKSWANKNLYEKAEVVGLGDAYLGAFGGPSSSVHGNWMDLIEFQLETHHGDGNFSPSFEWRNPRPQIGHTIALLAAEVARDYFDHLFGEPMEFLEATFDDLSERIRQAMMAHEAFLNRPK